MFLDSRVSVTLTILAVLSLVLGILGLPQVYEVLQPMVESTSTVGLFLSFLVSQNLLFWNILAFMMAAIVFERMVGIRRGFLADLRDHWRHVPPFFGFLVGFMALLALLQNLGTVAHLLFEKLSIMQSGMPFFRDYFGFFAREGSQLSLPTLMNVLFLLVLLLSLTIGYLRAPDWKHLRVSQGIGERTYFGPVKALNDPRKRKVLLKAEMHLERRRPIKAARLFESLGEDFYYRAGKLYAEKGWDRRAEQAFEKAGDYFIKQANYLRAGDAYFFGSHWQKAADAYRFFKPSGTFREDRERVKQWVSRWGESLYRQDHFTEAGRLYEEYGLFQKAGEAFEKAGLATAAAEAFDRVGDFDRSIRVFKESGQDGLATIQKGKLLFKEGDYTQAAALFEQSKEYRLAADSYAKASLPRKAAQCYERAGDLGSAAEMFLEAGEEETALKCYAQLGEFKKAGQLAAHLGLQDKQAEFFLKSKQFLPAARAFLMIGETRKAANCLSQVSLDNVAVVEDSLQIISILFDQDRLTDALMCAEGLVEGNKQSRMSATILAKLAEIHEGLGQFEKAVDAAYRAAGLAPEQQDIHQLLNRLTNQSDHAQTQAAVEAQVATEAFSATKPAEGLAVKPTPSNPEEEDEFDPYGSNEITQTLDDHSVFDLTNDGPLKRYRIIKEIGRGGMGMVYKAIDRKLNRPVALKMLHPEFNREPKILLFFRREARAVAALNHPNIVSLFDAGMEKGCFYMIMEYVEGYTLDKLFRKHRKTVQKSLTWIWYQVCQGLAYAHEQGIIHRDLKPTNIMVTKTRGVKVLDFGLAKQVSDLSHTQQVWGTPAFMAPELFHGERATFASDIYAIGATFYMLAAGKAPFAGEDNAKKFSGDGLPIPPRELNPQISDRVSKIILKCLYLPLNKRYKDVNSLMKELKGKP